MFSEKNKALWRYETKVTNVFYFHFFLKQINTRYVTLDLFLSPSVLGHKLLCFKDRHISIHYSIVGKIFDSSVPIDIKSNYMYNNNKGPMPDFISSSGIKFLLKCVLQNIVKAD